MLVVEVGFKLDKDIKYYETILYKSGAVNRFNCKTHDIYWTNKDLDGMSKNDTVGIIICKQDNEYVIKYCSDDRIIAREYELI